jgi:hypothetical protein
MDAALFSFGDDAKVRGVRQGERPMKSCTLTLAALLMLCPSAAQAQVRVGISLGLPPIPQLEVVAPGIQVVAGFQDEVFLQGGWYWCRRPDGWYRSQDPHAHFDFVENGRVPRGLSRMRPGQYRNWHRGDMRGNGGRMQGPDRGFQGHDQGRRGNGEHRGQ